MPICKLKLYIITSIEMQTEKQQLLYDTVLNKTIINLNVWQYNQMPSY